MGEINRNGGFIDLGINEDKKIKKKREKIGGWEKVKSKEYEKVDGGVIKDIDERE